MEKYIISVVIPVYNSSDYLARSLRTLADQHYKEFEVIVIDDGSTIDLSPVINFFKNSLSLKYFKISNSGGPAKPRNIGISLSEGYWISFLDADDYWNPNRLSTLVRIIKKNSNIDVFYHPLKIHQEGRYGKLWWSPSSLGSKIKGDPFIDLMTYGDVIPTSSAVVKKECFVKHGGFNESRHFSSVEDYDMWLRLALQKCKFMFINKKLGHYALTIGGISSNPYNAVDRNRVILEKYITQLSLKHKYAAISKFYYFSGSILCSAGKRNESLQFLQLAKNLRGPLFKLKNLFKIALIRVGAV